MSELFDAFGINWKLLVAQSINFGLLLLILWHFLYKPVLKMIDERRSKIAESVVKAEAADRRLQEADQSGKETIAQAAKEAQGIVLSARSRADEEGADILKRSQAKADQLLADSAARAEEEKRQVMIAGEKEIARAAMLAAEKLLKEKRA